LNFTNLDFVFLAAMNGLVNFYLAELNLIPMSALKEIYSIDELRKLLNKPGTKPCAGLRLGLRWRSTPAGQHHVGREECK
jgi:hypothetical protein